MTPPFKKISGSIVAPGGFLAGGVFCGIKRLGTGSGSDKGQKRDLALLFSKTPASVAGMFTTNQICAAPVKVCIERVKLGAAQAIVVNSGNANACTGRRGLRDARAMAQIAARHLDVPARNVLVASTGRIGAVLPMGNVRRGIGQAAAILGHSVEHANQVAEAILTSDTRPKQIAVEFEIGGKSARLGGVCKGAGMIQPWMSADGRRAAGPPPSAQAASRRHATMLCFITTDVAIGARALQSALGEAVAQSFNRITVDGDMSTNDTVLILANGQAGNEKFQVPGSRLQVFQSALNRVCLELARMIVRDGEGVHRVVTVRVTGARSDAEADAAARAVANSALVKTSWHGGDPNWGRIMDALGYSPATVVEDKVDAGYSAPGSRDILWSLRRGQPANVSFKTLCAAVAPDEFDLHVRLNLGKGRAVMYAADLTEAYVRFNKGNLSDPGSLGG